MANNTVLNSGSGGDTITDTDIGTFTALSTTGKVQGVLPYAGPDGATVPAAIHGQNGAPIRFQRTKTADLTSASINASSNGDNALVAAVASQTVRVFKLFLVCNAAVNIKFRDGTTDLTAVMNMLSNGSFTLDFDGEPWFVTAAGNAFQINLSAAVQVSGRIYYQQST